VSPKGLIGRDSAEPLAIAETKEDKAAECAALSALRLLD
jgi:hypothetical protein